MRPEHHTIVREYNITYSRQRTAVCHRNNSSLYLKIVLKVRNFMSRIGLFYFVSGRQRGTLTCDLTTLRRLLISYFLSMLDEFDITSLKQLIIHGEIVEFISRNSSIIRLVTNYYKEQEIFEDILWKFLVLIRSLAVHIFNGRLICIIYEFN